MEKYKFSSTKALKASCFSLVYMAAMALVIFINPNSAHSMDSMTMQPFSGIMLNTTTNDGPPWALMYGSSDNSITGMDMDSYGLPATGSTTTALGGGGNFRFARGTQASPAMVQTGDRLGFFVFSGYDGTTFMNSAAMTAYVDGPVSAGNVPTSFVFETNATGYPRPQRMIISSTGNVGIGQTVGSSSNPLQHPLQMDSGAYVSSGGVWTNASSRAYKENIINLTTEKANKTLDGLNPVEYDYKVDKEDKHVGFIAEDVPDLVATKDRKGLSPMDIVAVLTKVVQEQKTTISEQTKMISELSKRLDAMQQEINRVKGMNIVGSIGVGIK